MPAEEYNKCMENDAIKERCLDWLKGIFIL
jgi:hypothetical protein